MNPFAILFASLTTIIIGFFWYAKRQKLTQKAYFLNFISAVLSAYFVNKFMNYRGNHTLYDGIEIGFFCWLGFSVPALLTLMQVENKDKKLVYTFAGFQLISLVIMGAVIAFLS